ncbi:MAG TPA: hypothetical protein VHB02_11930 [Acidimicrobiales bacterium]|nr:hypothetical protein [Acidimicrobiales bacterium]
MAITKPGYSVKHGKLADHRRPQRETHDRSYTRGFETGRKALAKGNDRPGRVLLGPSPRGAGAAHRRHQHAGLAKGAKVAAYQYGQP